MNFLTSHSTLGNLTRVAAGLEPKRCGAPAAERSSAHTAPLPPTRTLIFASEPIPLCPDLLHPLRCCRVLRVFFQVLAFCGGRGHC